MSASLEAVSGLRFLGWLKMDFAERLASGSLKSQSAAALFLRAEGAEGYPFLSALLDACRSVDIDASQLSQLEECLVGWGALSMGCILNAVGYDEANALHEAVLGWLSGLSDNKHRVIAANAIHGLGELGIPPARVGERLQELVGADRRPDDWEVISCRGIAFRMLARLDRQTASRFTGSKACEEYLHAVEHWLNEFRIRPPDNPTVYKELMEESAWLRDQ